MFTSNHIEDTSERGKRAKRRERERRREKETLSVDGAEEPDVGGIVQRNGLGNG
jgi:hypothetical protein